METNESPLKLPADPLKALEQWMAEAVKAGVSDPTPMTLATSTKAGRPGARIVLFKGMSQGGIEFYTNFESRKAKELLENPFASLVFHWPLVHRQVRIDGRVDQLKHEESEAYFRTRPRGSQIGAWASPQSQIIEKREDLLKRVADIEKRFAGKDVPCPPFWGGFRVTPEHMEFWEERPSRLHERLIYVFSGGKWATHKVAP